MPKYANVLKSRSDVELPMKLVERYYNYHVVQTLKQLKEPIEGYLEEGELAHINHISDRQTREVSYTRHTYLDKPYGRSYALKHMGTYSLLKGKVRRLIIDGKLVEIDMRNAHPTLLSQIATKQGVEAEALRQYTLHKEKVQEEMMNFYSVKKGVVKELFCRLIFGGKVMTWARDHNIQVPEHNSFLTEYEADIKRIVKHLRSNNIDNWDFYENAAEANKKRDPQKSALAYYLQSVEEKCMKDVIKYLQDDGFKVEIWLHDGVYVRPKKDRKVDKDALTDLIKEKHNFNITFDEKSTLATDEDLSWYRYVQQFIDYENDDDILDKLDSLQETTKIDSSFFHHLEFLLPKKYDVCRDYRLKEPYAIECVNRVKDYVKDHVYLMMNNGFEFYVDVDRNQYGEVIRRGSCGIAQFKSGTRLGKQTSYGTSNWIENILELGLIDEVYDYGYEDAPGVLNIYRRPAIMERVPEPTYANLDPYDFVVNNICGDDVKCVDYFHDYMAFMLQERTIRPQVLMLIYGDLGGAGKTSVIVDLFCNKILGHDYFKANSKKDLVDTHSAILYEGKRFLVLEEVSFSGDKSLNAELKDITTRSHMTINPKYKAQYTIPDRSCLVAMSNSLTPLDIGERRVFAISPTRSLTPEEAQAFHDFIADDRNVRAVYQFYMERDISNFVPHRDIPKNTQAKKDLMESNNRWVDLKDYMRDLVIDFKEKNKEDEWKEHYESGDWKTRSTRFNLGHFRDYIAQRFSASRSLGLSFKGTSELGNELKRTLGLKVEQMRNGWRKGSPSSPWFIDPNPAMCVDFESFI